MWSVVAVGISGLVTVVAVVLGYLYTTGRWRWNTTKKLQEHSSAVSPADFGPEKTDVVGDRWPIDEPSMRCKMDEDKCIALKDNDDNVRPDPVEFCGHIQREIKRTKQRIALDQIESKMSPDQLLDERAAQRQQLQDIYQLMEAQKDKFGLKSVDDIEEQMKLYIQ